jgi:eukaryotic-like serine/threonine-protein kinase
MAEWLGKTIGKVRIEKYLARGGMAEVYLGTHLTLDRPVAVKVLHSYIEEDPGLLERFQREAKVVAGLRHPNIVQIYDFDAVDGHPFIVMEYIKGPSLSAYLGSLHKRNDRIPHPQVARLLYSLTDALDYAHEKGMVHRDIKPGNILLHGQVGEISLDRPLADDVDPVLTDFGLVRIANAASQTMTGLISGTPAYMSPEQARSDPVDHRTDIYSLGIVLYEILAGRVPFEADSIHSVIYKLINELPPPIPGMSTEIQRVLDRALAKKAEDRYPDAGSMAADFNTAVGLTTETRTFVTVLPEETRMIVKDPAGKAAAIPVGASGLPPEPPPVPVKRKSSVPATLWIGLGIFSLVGLIALVAGAVFAFSRPPSSATATRANSGAAAATAENVTDVPAQQVASPTAEVLPSQTPSLPDANGMVAIPAGSYVVGAAQVDDYHSAQMNVSLSDFWIDQYQVTYARYQEFLSASGGEPPEVPGQGDHPVRGVTWDEAVAYCSWVNKRLPTEAEWEVAGRGPGPDPQVFPWGEDPTSGGAVRDLPDQDTYEVGTISFNKSPFEVYDLVGNVWEWVGEPYASVPAGLKILRGGRFGLPVLELSFRLPVASDDARYVQYAGFRCAADQVR